MIRPASLAAGTVLALLCSACASTATAKGSPAPDRVLVTTDAGEVVRQEMDAVARANFKGTPDQVWAAVISTYADIGLDANSSDRSQWHYGAVNFGMPRQLHGMSIGSLFSCGSGMTGPLVNQGKVIATVVTQLIPKADGTTDATIYVDGRLQRNEGTSTDPQHCSTSGRLEELIRTTIVRKLVTG